MTSLFGNLKDQAGALAPNFAAFRDRVEEFVADVQEELGVLDELRYEWRRLQTFTDWPLEAPRPAELAKAGFYFSPAPDAPDRCAHFAADKFFSSWEPSDDPWEVLKDNCPDSPFVRGTSNNVPLPSAYEKHGDDADGAAAARGGGTAPAPRSGSSLSSYLSSAVQRVAAAMPAPAQQPGAAGAGAAAPPGAPGAAPAAPAAGGALEVTAKGKRKGRRGKGAGTILEAGGGGEEGGAGGEGSESGSATTPRTPRAPAGSKEELAAVAGLVGQAVSAMQQARRRPATAVLV